MSERLDAAYEPFVASLRTGMFRTPEAGWPAELIAAHVAMTNDSIADVAEQVAAGARPSYDNAAAVDETCLREFAEAAGGLPGLAAAVERSAARLAAAYDALGGDLGETQIPVLIRDGGEIAADRPMPIRSFCEGNASRHLSAHSEQLRALQAATAENPPGDPESTSVDILEESCASTATILKAVHAGDLDRPTPCALWSVKDVINHVIGGAAFFAELAETGEVATGDDDPDWTAGNFNAAFDGASARLVAAFRAQGAMEKVLKMPIGDIPGSVCVWIAAGDIFTHGWDLAKALGQPTDLEPKVAEQLLAQIEPMLGDDMRGAEGEAAFGPRVQPAESASAADRLAAFEGRRP